MVSKKSLAVALSKVEGFQNPVLNLEQYETTSEIASTLLWLALMNNDIEGKIVCDLGAGTGILGIGAFLLDARKVIFVEKEEKAVDILKRNIEEYTVIDYDIQMIDVTLFNTKCETIIMNPPFGAQTKNADRPFLDCAFRNSLITYSVLPTISEKFYLAYAKENNKQMIIYEKARLRLPKRFEHHKKNAEHIEVMIVAFKPLK
jgi:putative methylase